MAKKRPNSSASQQELFDLGALIAPVTQAPADSRPPVEVEPRQGDAPVASEVSNPAGAAVSHPVPALEPAPKQSRVKSPQPKKRTRKAYSPRRVSRVANPLQASLLRRPVRVLQGVADPVRYQVLNLLADGSIFSVRDLAKKLNAHQDTMGKHVKVLRTRGLVVSVRPALTDGRLQLVQIPQEFRTIDDAGKPVLDFGVCVVRFD